MRRQRINHPDEAGVRQPCKHAGVVGAHHASANDANAKRPLRCNLHDPVPLQLILSTPNGPAPEPTPSASQHVVTHVANAEAINRTRFDSNDYSFESGDSLAIRIACVRCELARNLGKPPLILRKGKAVFAQIRAVARVYLPSEPR